jgi:hypothetical protein
MDSYNWPRTFTGLFHDGLAAYRAGRQDATSMFTTAHRAFLDEIGATPQEVFDFVEDHHFGGDPGIETALLITAVRRDHFLRVQQGRRTGQVIDMASLPAKQARLDGIEWLPRIIEKARAKLRGEMPPELMYCCGGDRAFLREHNIHAADFLREVWDAGADTQRILNYVRRCAAGGPVEETEPVACRILPGGRVKC